MNFRVRSDLLRTYMAEHEIGMSILSHASSMFYFTNFSTVVMTGSRLALVLIEKEKTAILVPDVEAANAVGFSLEKGHVDEVIKYYEKCVEAPLYTSPYDILRDQLKGVKEKRIGILLSCPTLPILVHLLTRSNLQRAEHILIVVVLVHAFRRKGGIRVAFPSTAKIHHIKDSTYFIFTRESKSQCIVLTIAGVWHPNLSQQRCVERSWCT
jgi:Xaa-Pro aminopeptidase